MHGLRLVATIRSHAGCGMTIILPYCMLKQHAIAHSRQHGSVGNIMMVCRVAVITARDGTSLVQWLFSC